MLSLPDLDNQAGFYFEFFRVRQVKIGKHVAGTAPHLDTVNDPFFHFATPSQTPRQLSILRE
jgi:hypothetical protein